MTLPVRATERRLVAALPAAAAAAVLALAVAAVSSGAFGPQALADPGALVRWAAPVVTALGHLTVAVTVGALLLAVTLLPGTLPPRRTRSQPAPTAPAVSPLLRPSLVLAGGAAAAWALLAGARLVLDYATIVGASPAAETFGAQLGVFVSQISLGRMLLAVAVLAALASVLAFGVSGPTGAAWTLVVVGAALGILAQTGHAAGVADHDLAVSAMFLHLAGVSVWLGGLAVLALAARRLGADLAPAAARYSALAIWAYVAVGVSGVASAWIRVGDVAGLGTPYGRLVLVKVTLIVALGAAGFAHRRATLPRVERDSRAFWRLAAVELAAMGAVSGVAVALAGTAPPVPQELPQAPTPTESITGYPAPLEPSTASWFFEWRPDVLFALVSVVMVVVYARWVRRLRRRGDSWPVGRTVSWVTGAVLFFWVTNGAPAVYGQVLFSVHMFLHMVLAMVTPLLFVLAGPVTLALRALPARADASRGPREWLLALVESRWARFFAHPLVAAVNFAGSMIVFYFTPLFGLALSSHIGHVAMVAHFTLAGYLFANALVGVDPGPNRPAYPIRLVLLFATMAFHAFFGVALAQSTVLLAADWFGGLGLPWGVDALADQQQGANLAWAIGEVPTLALAAIAAVRWAREDERTARRTDRAAARDGDAELAAYNDMLAALAERSGGSRESGAATTTAADEASRPGGEDAAAAERAPESGISRRGTRAGPPSPGR